jgi:hypothetical protein
MSTWQFPIFIGDGSHVYRKKDPNRNAEYEVSMTRHPIALFDETGSCKMSL